MSAARHAADGFAIALPVIQERRRAACENCPHNEDDACSLCGCPLSENAINAGKIAWRSEQCPVGRWFSHNNQWQSFTREPTRHLLYHIYPTKRRDIWEWNLRELLKRIDLFNGRRIMGVVVDEGSVSVSAEEVQEFVKGHGFEFIVNRNDGQLGEVVSFLPLFSAVQSLDPNECVFYAHAKGISHNGQHHKSEFFDTQCPVKAWTETMYRVNLDNWLAVRDALASHGTCGAFRSHDKKVAPGHWSGTYFWFRSKDAYSRKWQNLGHPHRWGVESWPSTVFTLHESCCLFHDNTQRLYDLHYWNSVVAPELANWEAARVVQKEFDAPLIATTAN